jgi:hypothetical protein
MPVQQLEARARRGLIRRHWTASGIAVYELPEVPQ